MYTKHSAEKNFEKLTYVLPKLCSAVYHLLSPIDFLLDYTGRNTHLPWLDIPHHLIPKGAWSKFWSFIFYLFCLQSLRNEFIIINKN